jgi:lipid-binding SYLF domain-containing protein
MLLLKGKLKIGADASATAGPVGRKAEVGTDILLKSAMYSYSRAMGLFAGIALDGAVIPLDDDANHAAGIDGFSVSERRYLASTTLPSLIENKTTVR